MIEHLAPGHTAERDPITGQFTKTNLTADRAAELGKKAGHDRYSGDLEAERLIIEEGYNQDNPAPEYISIMAAQAVKAPQAMVHWRRYHERLGNAEYSQTRMQPPGTGEVCRLCGRHDSQSELGMLLDLADVQEE